MNCEVRSSPIHGVGVFATQRLKRNDFLMMYTGERINSEEATRRHNISPDGFIDGAPLEVTTAAV